MYWRTSRKVRLNVRSRLGRSPRESLWLSDPPPEFIEALPQHGHDQLNTQFQYQKRRSSVRIASSILISTFQRSGCLDSQLVRETLSPNSTLAHYRILVKLGAGGMGAVYLARDTKLDSKVALKVLPPDVALRRDRMERFIREAKAAAALNHPNIAHVYEIGETNGTHYIAMEYIDGVTLRDKIHRDKIPLAHLLKYLTQVAEGLSKAHAAGIVHRDLKPDNIMVTQDDYAKVLDFGLAKLVEPDVHEPENTDTTEAADAMTRQQSIPGVVFWTIGYMSPEQAQGKTIDRRSDIFSFGCVLFEAIT